MPDTLIHDAELPVTFQDCLDWLGPRDIHFLAAYQRGGLRLGQAWYHELTREDQSKLDGTLLDPFYHDTRLACMQALMYLLEY